MQTEDRNKENRSGKTWTKIPRLTVSIFLRALAASLGLFTAMNVLGEWVRENFDANLLWIDPSPLPGWSATPLMILAAAVLIGYAFWPNPRPWRRWLSAGTLSVLIFVSLSNTVQYYRLLSEVLVSGSLFPFSLLVAAGLTLTLWGVTCSHGGKVEPLGWLGKAVFAMSIFALGFCFPLVQMFCYGKTDYRRPADAIVVFGAGVYRNGRCSSALKDRLRTACRLHHEGLADTLLVSGGPGKGAVHETTAMRDFAIAQGVAPEAIRIDPDGLDTACTVRNTAGALDGMSGARIIAVSHFYHLPRIKLEYNRRGMTAYTVPARESRPLTQMPYYMLRETAAFWLYYFHPDSGR